MKLETCRDNSSGHIRVKGSDFTVIVEGNGHVVVTYPSRVVHVREDNHAHDDDASPRAAGINRKRGSR